MRTLLPRVASRTTHQLKVGIRKATATAKEAQFDAAESLFGHIIAQLDKHTHEQTLTPEIVEILARAYASVSTYVPDQPKVGQ